MGVAAKLTQHVQLLHHFGPKWVGFRVYYAALQRLGVMRSKLPRCRWLDQPLSAHLKDAGLAHPQRYEAHRRSVRLPFFFDGKQRHSYTPYFDPWDAGTRALRNLSDDLMNGTFRYFEHLRVDAGTPPAWNRNCLTGEALPTEIHWSEIHDFGSGDIKLVWEPNRFAFAYALVRMYWRTGDDSFAELFWRLVEDWQRQNPPQCGPNWKCGQEVALRVMAWCFGLYGFLGSSATTATRLALLAQMIAVSGQRIDGNLSYALSQQNNHGISEAMGLWTIGLLFPEFREASRWKQTGRKLLERLGRQLIYDDGGFSQHSLNYHRVMLHDYVWSLRLGELHDERFSSELYDRLGRAGQLLFQLQDEETGEVPCYGQNDGALVLPLSNCDIRDFRPVVQATAYLTRRDREYTSGPWDEELLWLFGPAGLDAPHRPGQREDLAAQDSGYFTLRGASGYAFVRAANFCHRPSQADCLHTDIWWRGQNIAIDAGTYSYNAPQPWDNPFARSEFHNTVTVDGRDQMDRAGRFLWLPWLSGHGSPVQTSRTKYVAYWEGYHNGYSRLPDPVTHRRGIVRLGDEHWLVADRLLGRHRHTFCLHWLLGDYPYHFERAASRLTLDTEKGTYGISIATSQGRLSTSLVRATQDSPRGWRASLYMKRDPALSLNTLLSDSQCWFFTLLGPESSELRASDGQVQVQTNTWEATIGLNAPRAGDPLVASVSVTGNKSEHLEIMACEFY
jgi:hypothetical protein